MKTSRMITSGLLSTVVTALVFGLFFTQQSTILFADLDVTPPSTPTGYMATGTAPLQVYVSWNTPTDNVAVAGYDIFKHGVLFATTSAPNFTDNTVYSNSWFTYSIRAYDAAGNRSNVTNSFAGHTKKWPGGTFATGTAITTVFQGARLRAFPATNTFLTVLNINATGTVESGPTVNNGLTWWRITASSTTGWVQENHIAPTTTAPILIPTTYPYGNDTYSDDAYGETL